MINFQLNADDRALVKQIAERACAMDAARVRRWGDEIAAPRALIDWLMDISAAANAAKLDLAKLLAFDHGDFAHDVYGIARHLNRENGQLGDCFMPRCAV